LRTEEGATAGSEKKAVQMLRRLCAYEIDIHVGPWKWLSVIAEKSEKESARGIYGWLPCLSFDLVMLLRHCGDTEMENVRIVGLDGIGIEATGKRFSAVLHMILDALDLTRGPCDFPECFPIALDDACDGRRAFSFLHGKFLFVVRIGKVGSAFLRLPFIIVKQLFFYTPEGTPCQKKSRHDVSGVSMAALIAQSGGIARCDEFFQLRHETFDNLCKRRLVSIDSGSRDTECGAISASLSEGR